MLEEEPKPVRTLRCGGCLLLLAAGIGLCVLFFFLIPFGPSGNKASKSQLCSTNLSLLASALAQYSQDYDGCFPCGVIRNSSGAGWAGQIYPYAKTDAVFRCPADISLSPPARSVVSYGYNTNVARMRALSGLGHPSNTVLLFETANCDAWVAQAGFRQWDEGESAHSRRFSPSGNGIDSMLVTARPGVRTIASYATGLLGGRAALPENSQFTADARHDGASLFLFGDGHVALFNGHSVSSGTNAATPDARQQGGVTGSAAGAASGVAATFSAI